MKMDNSITATRISGRVILFSTRAMITKIATIETVFTTLKSSSVVSIRSLVQGASLESYFFKIVFSSLIWAFTSSVAVLYSEFTRRSSQSSLFNTSFTDSGSISSGTRGPTTDSRPRAYLIPSTFSISWIMARTSVSDTSVLTSTIWVAPTPKSSCNLLLATT